jgi:hypothetical protein
VDGNDKAEFMLAVIDIMQSNNEAVRRRIWNARWRWRPKIPHYLLHYGVLLAQRNDRSGLPSC